MKILRILNLFLKLANHSAAVDCSAGLTRQLLRRKNLKDKYCHELYIYTI